MSSQTNDIRVLILGGGGMLGHKLWQVCRERFTTSVTIRDPIPQRVPGIFDAGRVIAGVDAGVFESVVRAIADVRPTAIVNCIGIVKQRPDAHDPVASIALNALFPHRLARLCQMSGARLIHLSTDCVYSGNRGYYSETDAPDPVDLYGQTKMLGEVTEANCLTIRTSMIGRELATSYGLVEWFLSQRGSTVVGFTGAIFSGLTTRTLAEIIADIIGDYPNLRGIWHIAAEPISKYDLLVMIRDAMDVDIEISPGGQVVIDRSLDASRFRMTTGWTPPSWPAMIAQLAKDTTPYDRIRNRTLRR